MCLGKGISWRNGIPTPKAEDALPKDLIEDPLPLEPCFHCTGPLGTFFTKTGGYPRATDQYERHDSAPATSGGGQVRYQKWSGECQSLSVFTDPSVHTGKRVR